MNKTLIAALISLSIGAGAAWWIQEMRWGTDIADLKLKHGEVLKAVSDKALADTETHITTMKALQKRLAELDKQHSEDLANAQAENNRMRDDVIAGTRRVRIAIANLATCQLTKSGDSTTGGVGDGTTVELSQAAGRNILDIRSGIINDQAKLRYLQDYVRSIQTVNK
ncbi:TPA: lysis system i-spanin subunit Rz [Yersinia enterocolitica]|uniref:lysis system i-spanin subunit Rz n=1 Tax=Yersinia enterocolitica TaxID=630 RepID=UPI0005DBF9B5|nr:lysis system i-spanin subunit Rz [Yersinia enterocolitica]MBW5867472.1 lysis protein [Yersinia enterocolitica]CQH34405.1 bacteriophage lysis protein [Yersinia enterocolitica]